MGKLRKTYRYTDEQTKEKTAWRRVGLDIYFGIKESEASWFKTGERESKESRLLVLVVMLLREKKRGADILR